VSLCEIALVVSSRGAKRRGDLYLNPRLSLQIATFSARNDMEDGFWFCHCCENTFRCVIASEARRSLPPSTVWA